MWLGANYVIFCDWVSFSVKRECNRSTLLVVCIHVCAYIDTERKCNLKSLPHYLTYSRCSINIRYCFLIYFKNMLATSELFLTGFILRKILSITHQPRSPEEKKDINSFSMFLKVFICILYKKCQMLMTLKRRRLSLKKLLTKFPLPNYWFSLEHSLRPNSKEDENMTVIHWLTLLHQHSLIVFT